MTLRATSASCPLPPPSSSCFLIPAEQSHDHSSPWRPLRIPGCSSGMCACVCVCARKVRGKGRAIRHYHRLKGKSLERNSEEWLRQRVLHPVVSTCRGNFFHVFWKEAALAGPDFNQSAPSNMPAHVNAQKYIYRKHFIAPKGHLELNYSQISYIFKYIFQILFFIMIFFLLKTSMLHEHIKMKHFSVFHIFMYIYVFIAVTL